MNRDEYLKAYTRETPEKYCAYCGKRLDRVRFPSGRLEDIKVFSRRKYCNRTCMRKAFVKVGTDTEQGYASSHHTARMIAYLVEGKEYRCEKCGSAKNIDVHHKDGNRNNNTKENLMLLCRSCHLKEHNPKGVCVICGEPMKGHGYCNKHLIRFRKYGNPLMYYHKIIEE